MAADWERIIGECAGSLGLGRVAGVRQLRRLWSYDPHPSWRVGTVAANWFMKAYDYSVFGHDDTQFLCGYTRILASHGMTPDLRLTATGEPFQIVDVGTGTYRMICRQWVVGGRCEPGDWDRPYLAGVGSFLGRMHEAVADWQPEYPRVAWNFSISATQVCDEVATWTFVESDRLRFLWQAAERIDRALAWCRGGPDIECAIHADLWYGNLLLCGGDLVAVDFDTCGMGPRAYDLAVWFDRLVEARGAEGGKEGFELVLSGYRNVRPLTDRQEAVIPHLAALRHMWFLVEEVREEMLLRGGDPAALTFYLEDHSAAIDSMLRIARR